MMDLNKGRDKAFEIAQKQGFYTKKMSLDAYKMLIISDLSAAVEAYIKDHYALYEIMSDLQNARGIKNWSEQYRYIVKGSVEDKLADVYIGLLKYAGYIRMNLVTFRGVYLAAVSDEKDFVDNCYTITQRLCYDGWPNDYEMIQNVMTDVLVLTNFININLGSFVAMKMKYNEHNTKRK